MRKQLTVALCVQLVIRTCHRVLAGSDIAPFSITRGPLGLNEFDFLPAKPVARMGAGNRAAHQIHVAGVDVVPAIAGKQAALLANTLIAAAGLACTGIPVGIPRGTERHLRIRIAPFPTSSPAGLTGSHRHSYQREAPGCDGEA